MICQASGSILKEKTVLASIACIPSLRLMTSDLEVSFTIKKETRGQKGAMAPLPLAQKELLSSESGSLSESW